MARAKKQPSDEAAADSRAPALEAPPDSIAMHDVAQRAYDLYLARGQEHGYDVQDWLQAERELRETP